MKIRDLGELQGDVIVLSGIYSNLQALEALIDVAEARNIPPTNVICLGDIVAYCADAAACVAAVRDWGIPVMAGNCEVQLAEGADDCGCGYDAGSECSLLSRGWYAHALKEVGDADRAWMRGLPDRLAFTHAGRRFACLHGGASDISRFIWPVTTDADIADEVALAKEQMGQADVILAGHSGIAMQRQIGDVKWQNVGAIGMPAHDGDPRTSFLLISDKIMEINRLEYKAHAATGAMERAGLTQGYHKTVTSGYWPSEDTLPPEMRLFETVKEQAQPA